MGNDILETMRQKQIILPKIYQPSNDSIEGWFVYFTIFNEYKNKMQRFKRSQGFKACTTVEQCKKNATALKYKYTTKLKNGWTPFNDKSVIWSDNLVYNEISKKHKAIRKTKRNIPYFLSEYLERNKNVWAKGSYDKRRSELRIFKKWLEIKKLDRIDISEFTQQNANQFFEYLLEKRKLRGQTLNNYALCLKAVWKIVKKKYPLIKDLWAEIPKYSKRTIPQRPLNRGIIGVLKNELEKSDPQLWLAAQFMYYCFIRPKELRFMQIKHINLFDGKITLYADITKAGKSRIVEIDNDFLALLWSKYELNKYPLDYYIFTTKRKPGLKPIGKNYFWTRFDAARKRLNIPMDYKFYGFKHTGAVAALKAGADIKDIQHQMGHSSIEITDEYLKSMVGYESEFFKKKMPGI